MQAYNYDFADDVFRALFMSGESREDGLTEIPAASYQLMVSALESILWEVHGNERTIIKQATGILERLRDEQKTRECVRGRK